MLHFVEERPETDPATLVHFAPAIVLSKDEILDACAGLANAERTLLAAGHIPEASWAATLLEHLEDRLAQWPDDQPASSAFSGSKSSDRELTQ